MSLSIKKTIIGIIASCALLGAWFLYTELFTATTREDMVQFAVVPGDTAKTLAARLHERAIIRNETLFLFLARHKGIDRNITAGEYQVPPPVTLARVVAALSHPGVGEQTITILPGWDLHDLSAYFEKEGIGTPAELYAEMGMPGVTPTVAGFHGDTTLEKEKPDAMSFEGYLAPETYRIYKNASVRDVVSRLIDHRDTELTPAMRADIAASGRTIHEVLTLASIVEREVRGERDKAMVADIFWRRLKAGWALQADSTVHYAVGKSGSVFTTAEDRESHSPWNTYKFPGLPPGPISNPSLESIRATVYPEENDYWFFLTSSDGTVYYAKTNEEHNVNRAKYLR